MPKQYPSGRRSSSNSIASITYWRKFAKHRLIYILLTIVFAFGIVAYFGSGPMGGLGSSQAERLKRAQEPIATVNGEPVLRGEYEGRVEAYRRIGGGDLQRVSMEGMLLGQLIDQAAARAAAKQKGLTVSDADIDKAIAEMKKGGDGKPISDDLFEEQLAAQGITLADLREDLRRSLLPQKLQESFRDSQRLTEDDLRKSYDEIKVRHILISVAGGPRPSPKALPDEQAKRKAEQILKEIRAGGDFATLANKHTTDPSNIPQTYDNKTKRMVEGRPKGGDLGWYKRGGGFVKEFEDAAFALKPGQVSDVVKTPFGYHIIKVEGTRRNLPKDFEKKKAELLENMKQERASREAAEFMSELRKNLKITWHDPSLQWRYEYSKNNPMMMMGQPPQGQSDQAGFLERLRAYVKDHPDDTAAALVLGKMLHQQYMMAGLPISPTQGSPPKPPSPEERKKMREEVIQAYETGLARTEDQSIRFELAQLYQENKQTDKALEHYNMIRRLLSWDDTTATLGARRRLKEAYKALGQKDLEAAEAKKIAELEKKQKEEQEAAKKAEEEAKKAEEEARRKRAAEKKEKDSATTAAKPGDPREPAAASGNKPGPDGAAPKSESGAQEANEKP